MARTTPNRSIEDVLREIAKEERAGGLLGSGKPGMGDSLLSGSIPAGTVAPAPSLIEQALRSVQARPNIGNGASALPLSLPPSGMTAKPSSGGLLSTGAKAEGPRGLLARAPAPGLGRGPAAVPPARGLMARVGNAADDFLFGGAAGDRRAEREGRDRERAAADAHRDAFSYASGPQGFDPNRYGMRMAELGQAPDMAGLVNLEGVNDGRDVRGARNRAEGRGVVGGVAAAIMGAPDADKAGAYESGQAYLDSQGQDWRLPGMGGLASAVGGAVGADSVLDNNRGERTLAEQIRAAQEAERFRNSDLGFRQDESQWERQYRESRAQAEDNQFSQELDYKREALTAPNSTGDVIAPILAKIATLGETSLTEGERALWANYQRQQQQSPWAGLMPGAPGAPAGGGAPAPAASAPAPAGDPFPGIANGQTVTQDGVSYRRQGNQMIPVG